MENAANVLEKLNRSQAEYECRERHPELDLGKLPLDLRRYAQCLKTLSNRQSRFNPRSRPNLNSARASITSFVTEITGRPHDAEIAHILSVLTGRKITAGAQKNWRQKSADLLEKVDRSLPMAAPPSQK